MKTLAAKFGRKMPDIMSAPPEVPAYLHLSWRAFWDLRAGTDDVSAVKWVDVQYWFYTYKLDYTEAFVIHECITTLDRRFIAIAIDRRKAAQAKAEAEEKSRASNPKRGR